jgi:gonadotropin-releasing hormone receptor
MQIGWAITVAWKGGDLLCRLMSFFRTFGLFLSGFMVMCISLDRYFAVLRPLTMRDINHRGRLMITVAWLASAAFSFPQVPFCSFFVSPDNSAYVFPLTRFEFNVVS